MQRVGWAIVVGVLGCNDPSPGKPKDTTEAGCPTDQVEADDGTCVPAACGAGRWGDVPMDDEWVFVDASAEEGGDGAESRPFRSITEAIDAGGARSIVVAAGTYTEQLVLGESNDGLALVGRCKDMVVLDASSGAEEDPAVLVDATSSEIALSGLTVTGGGHGGLIVYGSGGTRTVTVRDTDIVGNTYVGVHAEQAGTSVVLDHVRVGETRLDPDVGGRGVVAVEEANVIATSSTIEANHEAGVFVSTASVVTLESSSVLDTAARGDGEFGVGIYVHNGGVVEAEDCRVERNSREGVYVAGEGSSVTLTDTVVADTRSDAEGYGFGLHVELEGTLSATRLEVTGSEGFGVELHDAGTEVSLLDSAVTDSAYRGVWVGDGGAFSATGTVIERNVRTGLTASGAGTTVDLVATSVLDTQSDAGEYGRGIDVTEGVRLTAIDCSIQGNHRTGLYANGTGTVVELVNTTVLDTDSDATGSGFGISVEDGAMLTASGISVRRSWSTGILASGKGASVTLIESEIGDTVDAVWNDKWLEGGVGLQVQDGAFADVTSCTFARGRIAVAGGGILRFASSVVEDALAMGIMVEGKGSLAELSDTEVVDTQPLEGDYGIGVRVSGGAEVTLTGCTVARNHYAGVLVSDDGSNVSLVDTSITETAPLDDGTYGRGVAVEAGATLSGTRLEIRDSHEHGIYASGGGSVADVTDALIADTHGTARYQMAMGIWSQYWAAVRCAGCTVTGTEGLGVGVTLADLECSGCRIEDNQGAGAFVRSSTFGLYDSTILGTASHATLGGGVGLLSADVYGAPTLDLQRTTIAENALGGVWLSGSGTYTLIDMDIAGGTGVPLGSTTLQGDAVFVEGEVSAADLLLEGSSLHDAAGAGVFLNGAAATLVDNTWSNNGTDLWQQRCDDADEILPWDAAPSTNICPVWDQPTLDLDFLVNLGEAAPAK